MLEQADLLGNPAALHGGGRRSRARLEDAREELAGLLGAHGDEVIFTSGGSESDSIAVLRSAARWAAERPGVLLGAIEHPAVLRATEELGARVRLAGVEATGRLRMAEWAEGLDSHPAGLVGLASLMWVNNEVGTIQPVMQACDIAHRSGSWFHTDAVQALGHLDVHFAESHADLMSVSAHKIGGPVGIGALLVRRGVQLGRYGLGGGQEAGLRSGTQPVMLAAGFAAAARDAVARRAELADRLTQLTTRLLEAVSRIPGARVNGTSPISPAIVNVAFEGTSADDVMFLLDQRQIWCSTGSACRAGVHGPSDVLSAMGRDDDAARAGVRFSFGWSTTAADVDRIVAALPEVVAMARGVPRSTP